MTAPRPSNEAERLAELRRYEVLDTSPEPAFDRITKLAATLFGAPWAFVSLVDEHRQWFKSACGLDVGATERRVAFCAHTILSNEVLAVPDAHLDPRFAHNPLVTGPPHLRFYAGAPLLSPAGHRVGSLCVAGPEPRDHPPVEQLGLLADLAALVVDELELRVRVKQQQDLEVQSRRLASIVEWSNDAILAKSLDGTIQSWNPAAERLYGYRAEEVLGRNVSLLVPPDHQDEVPDILARISRGEAIPNFDAVRVAKDGRRIDVSLSISPLCDATGAVAGASTIARDVGAQKLLQTELQQAHDEALRTTRAKSAFLATMSHEIRTPMNGVIGMAGLLLGTDLTAEQRECAETVRSSAEALLTIINDILDFSKIEAGKLELELLDFDVRTVVEEVLELLAERAHGKGLELASLVHPLVPVALRGDPGRLRQILINLVGNAVKFTEAGEVVVEVAVAGDDEDGVVLRVEVRDTGMGIAAGAQSRLFDSFSQADDSTTRRYGGTGLGLAICKQLVELMGGHIGVDSEPGRGSRFSFTVRLERGTPAAALDAVEHSRLAGLRVLAVDDNAVNRLVLQQMLRMWRMHCECAESGDAAIALLEEAAAAGNPFDVALLDHGMPAGDGMTLGRVIKARPHLSEVRLVLLTSYVKRVDPTEIRGAGIDGYLVKPVRRSPLYDCLATVVGLEAAREPARLVTHHSVVEGRRGNRPRVLVVDDNAVNQKVAVRMLERLGYPADVAGNGQEAVAALQAVPYAGVLMDCQMPEMDGFDATRAIRRLPGAERDVPVIAMTAGVLKADQERCREATMDDFVAKPMTLNALAAVLERWLGDGRAPATAPREWEARPADGSATRDGPALDDGALGALESVGRDEVANLAQVFLTDAAQSLHMLAAALDANDCVQASAAAHRLKASSATLGARRLAALSGELEDLAAHRDVAASSGVVRCAEQELETVRTALEARFPPEPVRRV
ncbi:MAG: response regulator [Actinomycetota bacterium]|nr:response regulator [Actinomycetota bacterium]